MPDEFTDAGVAESNIDSLFTWLTQAAQLVNVTGLLQFLQLTSRKPSERFSAPERLALRVRHCIGVFEHYVWGLRCKVRNALNSDSVPHLGTQLAGSKFTGARMVCFVEELLGRSDNYAAARSSLSARFAFES